MRIVKVSDQFYIDCKVRETDRELLFKKNGRPCVLILQLKYRGKRQDFIIPIRSNIVPSTPKNQYFPLPPNTATKSGNRHGIHYIKLFPIDKRYIQKYRIDNSLFLLQIKDILDKNEKEIIRACQSYLNEYEAGRGHFMSPDIDGILSWL